jgi:hypothetical protein
MCSDAGKIRVATIEFLVESSFLNPRYALIPC